LFDPPGRAEVVEMIKVRLNGRFLGEQEIDTPNRSLKVFRPAERHPAGSADGSHGVGVKVIDGVGHMVVSGRSIGQAGFSSFM
jgi:hypothetical protein